jgi:phosphatidylserine decarboxylase
MNNRFGQNFFANPKVNAHLKKIFDAYGNMLRSPISREVLNAKNNGWLSSDKVNYKDFIHDPTDLEYFGFSSWNDWFSRRLAPNARPVDSDPNVIVHSSESYCL